MRLDLVFRICFILYCIEAGIFLLFVPWSPMWERSLAHLSLAYTGSLALDPLFRGAVTGFGLIHLVWGTHDLQMLLRHRRATSERNDLGS
jgi:hypothetical protein